MSATSACKKLTFELSGDSNLSFELSKDNSISFDVKTPSYSGASYYGGATVVIPDFDEITLYTANKFVDKNITVEPIQVERVSNLSGGLTVYIGGII